MIGSDGVHTAAVMSPRTAGSGSVLGILGFGWGLVVGASCARHPVAEEQGAARAERLGMLDADSAAHLAELTAFARSIPFCTADQRSIPVEEFVDQQHTEGDCVLVRGELVFDSAPVPGCRNPERPDGPACIADWALFGPGRPIRSQTLPGSRAIQPDRHTLFLYNDFRFDKPKRLCETDTGVPRMPARRLFRLPDAYRERMRPPNAPEMPKIPVVILGEISNFKTLDLSAICRTDRPNAGLLPSPAPARPEP